MGKTITVTAEKELEPQIEILFAILEQVDRNKLIHGFSLQVGWSVYYLQERETGNFILTTPDYSRNPFEYITEDLTLALWVQLEQSHFLRKINVDGSSIKFSDKIILSKGVLELEKIYLQRKMVVIEGNEIKAVLNENDIDVFKDSL